MDNLFFSTNLTASSASLRDWIGLAIGLWASSFVILGLYRLYFHPLTGFPGPKLAALTLWYETYYDVWLRGKYVFKIKEMHEKYGRNPFDVSFAARPKEFTGPIVRINPYEIHIDDPEFYHQFYSSRKLKKYGWYYKVSGVADVSFVTEDHKDHRQRVGIYKNLFALRSIHQFEPQIRLNIDKFCVTLEDKMERNDNINVSHAYRALTSDTITSYIGLAPNPLSKDANLGETYRKYGRIVAESSVVVRHFPPLAYFRLLPGWLITRLSSNFSILKSHLEVSSMF